MQPFKSMPGFINEVKISDVKRCLPKRCDLTTGYTKSKNPFIRVLCSPPMKEAEFEYVKQSIFDLMPLKEIFTEETGHDFFIYPNNDSTKVFTFII